MAQSLSKYRGPLLTLTQHQALLSAQKDRRTHLELSLDLGLSQTEIRVDEACWHWQGKSFPLLSVCKPRSIYFWQDDAFCVASRFEGGLYQLVATDWGPPTFEIDGIKMLPTAQVSPLADAERKVALVKPHGLRLLDTCGGLGYFARCALAAGAAEVISYEKNSAVFWLRQINAWSPDAAIEPRLSLTHADITAAIGQHPSASVQAVLHDPPRFGIAGELYSQAFYGELARVLVRGGRLFHYTGRPNQRTSGRDVPKEVSQRLQKAGFTTELNGDGVLARR